MGTRDAPDYMRIRRQSLVFLPDIGEIEAVANGFLLVRGKSLGLLSVPKRTMLSVTVAR